jgi:hypothetical protein
MGMTPSAPDAIVDLVPFLLVADVERSIPFYERSGSTWSSATSRMAGSSSRDSRRRRRPT